MFLEKSKFALRVRISSIAIKNRCADINFFCSK